MTIVVFTLCTLISAGFIAVFFDSKEYTDKVKTVRERIRTFRKNR